MREAASPADGGYFVATHGPRLWLGAPRAPGPSAQRRAAGGCGRPGSPRNRHRENGYLEAHGRLIAWYLQHENSVLGLDQHLNPPSPTTARTPVTEQRRQPSQPSFTDGLTQFGGSPLAHTLPFSYTSTYFLSTHRGIRVKAVWGADGGRETMKIPHLMLRLFHCQLSR